MAIFLSNIKRKSCSTTPHSPPRRESGMHGDGRRERKRKETQNGANPKKEKSKVKDRIEREVKRQR